ncbi:MAG: toll/interleukin-1 receptor domain-containing protein [Rubrivivax sp.]|nr:toll/interleukin-1 receptor domain-containing protein [Rubrivivax sp.]
MTRLFISYRRADADADAGRMADRLAEAFGLDNVFRDHEALQVGMPWRSQIDDALARSDVTLVIIGPGWLQAQADDGSRRLDDPEDLVAYEISRSIERGTRIVPVLVRDAALPEAPQLPAALRALPSYQGWRVRNDSFGPDMNALIDSLDGTRRQPKGRRVWIGAAVGALAIGMAGAWWWTHEGPEVRRGSLGLRIQLGPEAEEAGGQAPRFLLSVHEPVIIRKSELPPPKRLAPGLFEVEEGNTPLPGRGERYRADVRRQPLSARLDHSPHHGRTSVCLERSPGAPTHDLRARLSCDEGENCARADDDPGHFHDCGQAVQGRAAPAWTWWPTAFAQAPNAPAWVVPSIETLRARAGTGPDFTAISLTTPPLPQLAEARAVSVQLAVNGHEVLIDGFPPDASAVDFDPKVGVRLDFGLENLNFTGAQQGMDHIDVVLRFLAGQRLVREARATLAYISLRDHEPPTTVGDPALGLRWSARAVRGNPNERWQVWIAGAKDPALLMRARVAFDQARLRVSIDGQDYPLTAHIRPPSPGLSDHWGLYVGIRQPSGQLYFILDDVASAAVCQRLAESAGRARVAGRDGYRRTIDGPRVSQPCQRLLPG